MPNQDFDLLTKNTQRLLTGLMIIQSDEDSMEFSIGGREYELDYSPSELAERIAPASLLLAQLYARQHLLTDFNLQPIISVEEDELGEKQFFMDVQTRSEHNEIPQFSLIAPFVLHVFDNFVLRKDLRYNLEQMDVIARSTYERLGELEMPLEETPEQKPEQAPEPDADGMSLGM